MAKVEKHRELLRQPCVPMHLDYHPLNLLMNDGEVACIVDLEHLQPYPIAVGSWALRRYKLIRQAMVNEEPAARFDLASWMAKEFSKRSIYSRGVRAWRAVPNTETDFFDTRCVDQA